MITLKRGGTCIGGPAYGVLSLDSLQNKHTPAYAATARATRR